MAPITRVAFEYRLNDGPRMRVVADPAVRSVPIFEHMDASGSWRQAVLTDVPPEVLMEIGLMVAAALPESPKVFASLTGLVTIDVGNITGVQGRQEREVKTEPSSRRMWREGVSFPVELEWSEATLLDVMIREKFMPERVHHSMPDEPSRLLRKIHDALNKFRDKRIADEEFAASLTDEEREVIRARRANAGRTDKP